MLRVFSVYGDLFHKRSIGLKRHTYDHVASDHDAKMSDVLVVVPEKRMVPNVLSVAISISYQLNPTPVSVLVVRLKTIVPLTTSPLVGPVTTGVVGHV